MDIIEFSEEGRGAKRNHHPWERARFDIIFSFIEKLYKKEEGIVLDVGCGDAFFSELLVHEKPKIAIIGIDNAFSDELLFSFRKRFEGKNIRFFKTLNKTIKGLDHVINQSNK